MKILSGTSVSEGISIGKANVYKNSEIAIKEKKDQVPNAEKQNILNIWIDKTKQEIEKIYKSIKINNSKEAEIFHAQILFLENPTLLEKVNSLIKEGYSVAYSVQKSFYEIASQIEQMENTYFKEGVNDVKDVSERLIRNILKKPKTNLTLLS